MTTPDHEAFEKWFSDYHESACREWGGLDCTNPKGIAEDAWLAAKKQALEELEVADYQVRFKAPWDEDFGTWSRTSKMERYSQETNNGWEIETRTLYAKKGE